MAKMTNTKSLVKGSLLKWIVTAALLIVLIYLITANYIFAEDIIIVISAICMLVPSAIAYLLYYSWYNKYVPKKPTDGTSFIEVPVTGFVEGASTKTKISILSNLVFAIIGSILTALLNTLGDITAIIIYLIVSAIVFSAIDFVLFHVAAFKPNN